MTGGADNGAVGPGGTTEKDVTLSVARKLRALIQNSLGFQVFLTRERDQELSLDERTAIANNYKADLFVSIHANSSRARAAVGSEVYFLSYQASDDESRRVALVEGAAVAPNSGPSSGSAEMPSTGGRAVSATSISQIRRRLACRWFSQLVSSQTLRVCSH